MKRTKSINNIFKTATTVQDLIDKLNNLPSEVKKGRLVIETKTVSLGSSGRAIRWIEGGIMDKVRFRVKYDDNVVVSISRKTI